jgi:hypothetical protein
MDAGFRVALLILVIFLLYIYLDGKESVFSSVDGRYYPVIQRYSDQRKAANLIGEINLFAKRMIRTLEYVYITRPRPDSKDHDKGIMVTKKLLSRYNPSVLSENDPADPSETSYTLGKGVEISLCLREKQTGKNLFHDISVIKFVFLHELAHVVSVSYDHGSEFWDNFRFILEFCEKYNLYRSPKYHERNEMYCGLLITYNPVYDENVPSYF